MESNRFNHYMRLNQEPLDRIKAGIKKIEFRLNDDKRKKIQVGDTIIFSHTDDQNDQINTKVIKRVEASSFNELMNMINPVDIGYTEADRSMLVQGMRTYYSAEQEEKYGVVALYIKKLEEIQLL